jgi:hypothetical protein
VACRREIVRVLYYHSGKTSRVATISVGRLQPANRVQRGAVLVAASPLWGRLETCGPIVNRPFAALQAKQFRH